MHADKRIRSLETGRKRSRCNRPRVVLFKLPGAPRVEVLELPEDAGPGYRMCHDGRMWLVTGCRTGSRVLIVEPEAN